MLAGVLYLSMPLLVLAFPESVFLTLVFIIPTQMVCGSGAFVGELQSVGLGSMSTPSGVVQNLLEFVAAQPGMSWFGGIVLSTIAIRTLMLPITVAMMRNNVTMMNLRPEMQLHADRIKQCAAQGDEEGKIAASQRLQELMKKNGVSPLKSLYGFAQIPVFLSFFFALRSITGGEVASIKTGGYSFFTDLTAADPTYVLPVVTATTMLLSFELSSRMGTAMSPTMKKVFRGLALVTGAVTATLPMGIHAYWITSNIFTLGQVAVLNTPPVKRLFKIPDMVKHPDPPKQQSGKGFWEELQSSFKAAQAQQRREMEAKAAQEALKEANKEPPKSADQVLSQPLTRAAQEPASSKPKKGRKTGSRKQNKRNGRY
ncbi:hypothetical protein PTSG_07193 [Salpingoeca rosetta]|uniref:Membrane insertase YidC/Oxa/ALB C-terminal domain-containing protein n=1 Tax=Salpingoeca rosetta (strain ATCC 50818 / BSB-021) TaxID=946362 RepID=F2UEB9_SALR5|nr:uncharacterized protein PTSG_07193 [Salpingoeca rosetta]EGD74969.1 hypothetical protein PTSG_07193 [Salpingoeca rosetta]|eukprot:XP_004992614.1 hypothetical protein PTSG_07193 [Salpingoeca rosetta]